MIFFCTTCHEKKFAPGRGFERVLCIDCGGNFCLSCGSQDGECPVCGEDSEPSPSWPSKEFMARRHQAIAADLERRGLQNRRPA